MKQLLAFVLLILLALYFADNRSHARHAPGVLVSEEPNQRLIAQPVSWKNGEYRITPLADFHLRARVIGTERYWFDRGSRLSPIDYFVGWGPMSDQKILDQLWTAQGQRRCRWGARGRLPLPSDELNSHSANMHMIPSSQQVDQSLKSVRAGDIIGLSGYLVLVESGNWRWKSSLSRTDSGDGACELVWVERLSVE